MIRHKSKLFLAILISACAVFATQSHAGTGTIIKQFSPSTIFATGTSSIGGFTLAYNDFVTGAFNPNGTLPTITSISYSWAPFKNGATSQTVKLCYRAWNGGPDPICSLDISGAQTGSNITSLNTVQLKYGTSFYIQHTLFGGTYPATRPVSLGDSVTINYSF